MKKIVLFILLLLFSPLFVDATSVSSIDMDIYVDNNGNAFVTETWVANVTEGTEGYHPYYNLGNAILSDLSVSMDGKSFETVYDWNIDNSFSEKSYKAGFYRPDDNEIDICFGISNYGVHTYVIKYKISGFVVKLGDSDMIYFNLFPKNFSASPNNVSIKIHSDFKYSDTLDVWGYGKYGAPCYVYNGIIEMTSDGVINEDEYLTILVKFPMNTFNTSNVLDNEFDYYYNMAQDGATSYSEKKANIFDVIMNIIFSIISFIPFLIAFAIALFSTRFKNNNLDFGPTGNKIRSDVPNFREIPCNKDIFRAYWVADSYKLNRKKEDFLGAVILKWLQNGNVKIEKVETKKLFKNSVDDNIIFVTQPTNTNEYEINLYKWMLEASRDGKLEKNEFKNWCSKHYSKILEWFDEILEYENKMLVNEGKAKIIEKGKVIKYKNYEIDSSMMIEAEQMAGLKKFLKEFTLIKEREPIEVQLWNEYLMYASIFGIADKVAEQFKKLYPEIVTDMDRMGYSYGDIIFINSISSDGINSASTARARAQSYSSGGGGFSSGGGGGGSFGGGGGGGGFR